MKKELFILFSIVVLSLFIVGCAKEETQLANPAAVYCESQGGTLSYVEDEAGTRGICTLTDGTVCDEWAYYRGECPAEPADTETEPDTAQDDAEETQDMDGPETTGPVEESPAPIAVEETAETDPEPIEVDIITEMDNAFNNLRSYEYQL
jgi:hypothetical protein